MAIINSGNTINNIEDMHEPIILDLKSRNFIWPSSYNTVAIVGDSNSQILTFEVDAEYDGVPLKGTSCILSYWTSWTDNGNIHSAGDINLGDPEEIVENGTVKLRYKWTINYLQTAKPGYCLFSLGFYLNLDDGFYYENEDISELVFSPNENGKMMVYLKNKSHEIDSYYSLKSNSGTFTIIDNGIKSTYEDIELDGYEERLKEVENSVAIAEENANEAYSMANEAKEIANNANQNVNNKQDKFADVIDSDSEKTLESLKKIVLLYQSNFDPRANSWISLEEMLAKIFGSTIMLESVGETIIKANKIKLLSDNGIDINNTRIYNLAEPINNNDAVNKQYLDTSVGNIESALDAIIELQNSLLGGDK